MAGISNDPNAFAGSSPADVIVAGAGPAGATAARTLAAAGARVRLLDRASFPRNKPCGGGISTRVERRFPYLRSELSRIVTHRISKLYLEGPGDERTLIESDEPAALMIRRVEFDALLVSLACEAGAELITGADIVHAREIDDGVELVARDGRSFRAPLVVAADGVHSPIARRLGIRDAWRADAVALDMMEETPRTALRDLDPSALWVSYGYDPQPGRGRAHHHEGYAYIFPKRDHVNIGIGYLLSHFRAEVSAAPYDLQRSFVEALRARGIVEGESMREHFTPFLIPVGGPLRRPGRGRVLVAGDAGGFVNGFTAEGIYYAMVSGDLAARAILAARGRFDSLVDRYARDCADEIGVELQDSVVIRRFLFADRSRIAHVIRGSRLERELTSLFLGVATGRCAYAAFRRRVLRRAPRLAIQVLLNSLRTWALPNSRGRSTIP